MMRIALCDDDKRAIPIIAGAARSAFEAKGLQTQIDLFYTGEDLLRALKDHAYQLMLLDIDMPGLDGIEVGRRIRARDPDIPLVYVSEHEERVFDSFAVQPLGFVRKSRFLTDIVDVVGLYENLYRKIQSGGGCVEFTTRTSVVSVHVEKIRYIESSRNEQWIYLADGSEPVRVKMTMEKLEEKMRPHGFIRIHKGYLVNYRFIRRIDTHQINLLDGSVLPIGRSKAQEVRERYLSLLS